MKLRNLAGLAAGATLTYFLDRRLGEQRRNNARRRLGKLWGRAQESSAYQEARERAPAAAGRVRDQVAESAGAVAGAVSGMDQEARGKVPGRRAAQPR